MKALVIVDVQNDFCPGGNLPVPDGDKVVPVINRLFDKFDCVVATQDWHPAGHMSFASTHGKNPFEAMELNGKTQMIWPDHCIQNSQGADFHPDLKSGFVIYRKGMNPDVDSYSGFSDNDGKSTGMADNLRKKGISELYICGLALNYCVLYTALDAVREGFKVSVILDACKGIEAKGGDLKAAEKQITDAGIALVNSGDIE